MTDKIEDLNGLRTKIDSIDLHIIRLLKERLEIVKEVAKVKAAHTGTHMHFLRPGREATMLRNLIKKSKGILPPGAITTIWRMIISSSLTMEQNISVTALSTKGKDTCYWLAREYYGTFVPIHTEENSNTLIRHVTTVPGAIGFLPLYDNSSPPWWVRPIQEKNDVYIFARVPFVESSEDTLPPAVAVANVLPEPTEDDVAIFSLCTQLPEKKIKAAFSKAHLKITFLASYHNHYLIEADSFLSPEDPRILLIEKTLGTNDKVRFMGSYAAPLML